MAARIRNEESASYKIWTLFTNRWACKKPCVLSVPSQSLTFSDRLNKALVFVF